jgi:hypothetical protein
MSLRIGCAAALGWMLLAGPAAAEPAPIERAKQAYAEGVALHAAGKLSEAIEKFKLSYELSHNPLLLYDIGITLQQAGSNHLAVVYYRQFLAEAAPDAAHRGDAGERIAALTSSISPSTSGAPDTAASGAPAASSLPDTDPSGAPDTPDRGDAAGFAHRPIESAPPGQPLDVTAALPAARPGGARWTVTLRFRNAGQAGFTATPMVPRGGELVGRIPAARMTGSAVQYYLEARDPERGVVARSGRSTAPNVVALDAAAPPRFFPDVAEPVLDAPAGDGEDPLARRDAPVAATAPRGDGVLDVGSPRFGYAKWGATAVAGTGIAVGAVLYFLARDHGAALADDATGCGAPPCQKFDAFDRDIERTGQLEQTISNAALIGGIAAAAVAGYFWYRELRWSIAPSVATGARSGFTGATAAVRF